MKKVSLYIPAWNSSRYINECLESVHSQSYPVSEIIVIDDASSDDTAKIASGHGARVIKTGKRMGLAYARNLAIAISKYEYIASIDSDVALNRDWLENIMKNFSSKEVAGAGGMLIENNGGFTASWRKLHMRQGWGDKRVSTPKFLFGSNCVFRKGTLSGIGGYNTKYKTNYEDVDISRRLLEKGHALIYDPSAICHHKKKDNIFSLVKAYYRWTFYGYLLPDNFRNLLFRLIIVNPYKSLQLCKKDILTLSLINLPVDAFMWLVHNAYDISYFREKNAQNNI